MAASNFVAPESDSVRTPERETIFTEFKSRVQHLIVRDKFLHRDHFLEKWLIARDWDVDKAVIMFTESDKFKKEMNVDHLLEWEPPAVLKQYYCGGIIGFARDGSPVKFATTNQDLKGLLLSCRRQDIIRLRLRECEQVVQALESQTKKLGRWVDKMIIIFDQTNASEMLWGPARDLNAFFAKMLESNYPDMLGKMMIVNAPNFFPLLWKLFRPFLAEETRKKIFVLGGDYQSTLQKYIDDEQLPRAYGGALVDELGDPKCAAILGPQGLKVPEELYISDGLANIEGAVELELRSGEKKLVDLHVPAAGSFLKYEFSTRSYDIAFGIDLVQAAGANGGKDTRRQVLPVARFNSHMAPEDGTLLCEEPGLYQLVFDNSYSWTRNKLLQYKTEVLPPVHDADTRDELRQMVGDQ